MTKWKASENLKKAALWEGSILSLSEKYNSLRKEDIIDKITSLHRCDDRTPKENEFLRLLEQEIKSC